MIQKVVTGGETGTEQAAWTAARRAGIATEGYMPRRFQTEDGPMPRLGALYGGLEFPFDEARRIRANLRRAEGLFWIGDADSPRALATFEACRELAKPFLTIDLRFTPPTEAAHWLSVFGTTSLVITGDPASKSPGIGQGVEVFLERVFAALRRLDAQGKASRRGGIKRPGDPNNPTANPKP